MGWFPCWMWYLSSPLSFSLTGPESFGAYGLLIDPNGTWTGLTGTTGNEP